MLVGVITYPWPNPDEDITNQQEPRPTLYEIPHLYINHMCQLYKSHLSAIYLYPRPTKLEGGVYWIHLVRPSVRLSVDDMVSGA